MPSVPTLSMDGLELIEMSSVTKEELETYLLDSVAPRGLRGGQSR
jgi:hypothetical protein